MNVMITEEAQNEADSRGKHLCTSNGTEEKKI